MRVSELIVEDLQKKLGGQKGRYELLDRKGNAVAKVKGGELKKRM